MSVTPERPKYQIVADKIESEIRRGKWDGGRMPSVRGIAELYTVSIVTASRALQVLRDKGLIQSVERSGTFRLPASTAERWAVVLRMTPGPYARAVENLCRAGFEALSRREAMHLHFDAFTLTNELSTSQAETAAKAAKANGIHGVFLLPSRASDADAAIERTFIEGCRIAALPVVLLERHLRGCDSSPNLDLVCLDDFVAGMETTQHLIDFGRKRIAFAFASPTSSHNKRAAGYLFAMHKMRMTSPGKKAEYADCLIRLPEELPTANVYGFLADRIIRDRIDAIICYHDYIAIGLIVELLTRGIKVPEDVSVIGFDSMDVGELFSPGLTTYSYPSESLAEQALILMRHRIKVPDRQSVTVVVPGQLLVRGSCCTAHSQQT